MARTDGTPRARAKRDQILEGAQTLFLGRGFAATSTDAIAREAGVSKQTLYAYYPTKEELFADVLRRFIGEGPRDWMPPADERSLENIEDLRRALTNLARRMVSTLMRPDYLALVRVIIARPLVSHSWGSCSIRRCRNGGARASSPC